VTAKGTIEHALLNTDGGSRGNPGASGIGFTISVDDGRGLEIICDGGWYIGIATNNQAEYQALIWGLQNARELGVCHLSIQADSELAVKQLLGAYRVKNEGIKPLFNQVKALLEGFERYDIEHVMREHNSLADDLANQAMDEREPVGDYVIPYSSAGLFDDGLPKDNLANRGVSTQPPSAENVNDEPSPIAAPDPMPKQKEVSGMYTLTVKDHFDAAHALIGYPGECRNLHGHTWDIEVSVKGTQLDEVGIVYDFKSLKSDLKQILDDYDHKYLNEVPPFNELNATAENLARIIYEQLELLLPSHIELAEVSVWESPIAKLTYTRD